MTPEAEPPSHSQRFIVLDGRLAVGRLAPGSPVPTPPVSAQFWNLAITPDEISIVCDEASLPRCDESERAWRGIKVLGPLDFSLQGVLASLVNPLAEMALGVFVVSTYDTDYILVKEFDLPAAIRALTSAGHEHVSPS